MRRVYGLIAIATLAALQLIPPPVAAAQRAVKASTAVIQAAGTGAPEAVALVTLDNGTMYDVYVTGAQTDVAGAVELRQVAAGGAKAAVLAEAPVPAFGQLEMSPKGVHIALTQLKRPLKPGETVTLTLVLDNGDRIAVEAIVK